MTARYLYRLLRSYSALMVYEDLRARGWTAFALTFVGAERVSRPT